MRPAMTTDPANHHDGPDRNGRLGFSLRELRAMALLSHATWTASELGQRLEMTRQGAYKLLGRLHRHGFVARAEEDGTHVYEMRSHAIVLEHEIVERPAHARLFLCIRCGSTQQR